MGARSRSHTRRSFVRGIASAGAATAAASALEQAGAVDHLFAEEAFAAKPHRSPLSDFNAIGASRADSLEVPAGFRSQVLISYGDVFRTASGRKLEFGYNNDFLAYLPLRGSREGLLFVNHEYPDPFFIHGYKEGPKSPDQIRLEQTAVGNSVLHIRRDRRGRWSVVPRSRYHRRITGSTPEIAFTGPLRGAEGIGASAAGSVANCSGGITPWGTVLSCEENFQDYGPLEDGYGWGGEYDPDAFAKYGWVVEHDPYRPRSRPRKHTALGRFRHENTAFRQRKGGQFVLYMGDDKVDEGVYKFVSKHSFKPDQRKHNLRILEEGKLYVARWEPEGRRRFANAGDTTPLSPTEGSGRWLEVPTDELRDPAAPMRARLGEEEWLAHFATNRPEDVEVTRDGRVFIALTNNSGVKDSHGSIRVLHEEGNDPEASEFSWVDYAAGGPTGREAAGQQGFSSPDNLVFDREDNLWVLTDISSSRLGGDNEYGYHANNAVFMVPTSGSNRGVAFRFANMPVHAEGTGPWFTPDERTLFFAVQHPGEETSGEEGAELGNAETYTSWWPNGNRTTGKGKHSEPLPSIVAVWRPPKRRRRKSRGSD